MTDMRRDPLLHLCDRDCTETLCGLSIHTPTATEPPTLRYQAACWQLAYTRFRDEPAATRCDTCAKIAERSPASGSL